MRRVREQRHPMSWNTLHLSEHQGDAPRVRGLYPWSQARIAAKVIQDVDIESEDPQTPSDLDEGQTTSEVPSGTPSASTKPMTTRQAVLASVVDPTHVSLRMSLSLCYCMLLISL